MAVSTTVCTDVGEGTQEAVPPPLVLDLDGTLLRTDLLYETLVAYLRRRPFTGLLNVCRWLLRGRAALKQELARHAKLDIATLPVNEALVAYASDEHAKGRPVHLATAADGALAREIALRFPFIDEVIASDGRHNLKAGAKAAVLADRFPQGFVYAGDARADLAVWRKADGSVLVGVAPGVERKARRIAEPEAVFARPGSTLATLRKGLRLHQWAKNALVFVPMILGGKEFDIHAWAATSLGFLALGIVASATYLINDLWDLPDDRRHWSKRERPLASGRMAISTALMLVPAGVAAGLDIAAVLGRGALAILAAYLVLTLAYSFRLKREPLVDAFALASLFTLRIGFGIVLAGTLFSPWLLTFSMFLFLSLSLAKRHTEVERMIAHGHTLAMGRGYRAGDGPLLLAFGAASGMGSVLVMVLYLINEAFPAGLYTRPGLLWAFPAVLFLWVARIWLLCQRGELRDDPVAFALKDRTSLALGGLMGLAFLGAALGHHLF